MVVVQESVGACAMAPVSNDALARSNLAAGDPSRRSRGASVGERVGTRAAGAGCGRKLFSSSAFNIADIALNGILSPISLRGLQLDSKTRTGWVVGADLQQLQRFSY